MLSGNPRNLVGYCGLYCGACGIYQGKIRQAVENLRKIIKAYGFDKYVSELAKWDPAFQHYDKFEKVLDGFSKMFGECTDCLHGGGDPNCKIRECCKQRGYRTCAECNEMEKCEHLKRYPQALASLREIRAIGMDKWAEKMQGKVDQGYSYLDERLK